MKPKTKPNTIAINIDLPPELHRLAKTAASFEGKTLTQWVRDQLQHGAELHARFAEMVQEASDKVDAEKEGAK
jgi:HicB family